jgi:hypothetical protein
MRSNAKRNSLGQRQTSHAIRTSPQEKLIFHKKEDFHYSREKK